MRKVLAFLTIALLTSAALFAQDMQSATDLYNQGANALNEGNKTAALQCFEDALAQGEIIGAEAEELIYNCKKNIPAIIFSIGKEQASEKKIDEAIATLQKAVEKATEFGQNEIKESAEGLIPQLYMQQGNIFLNNKDYRNAADYYKKVIGLKPTDGIAYLRLGQVSSRLGDIDGALEALKKAGEYGQSKAAVKESAKLYLLLANKALQNKDYAKALEYAEESIGILPNPTALQIAGKAASAVKDYDKTIKYYEELVAADPASKKVSEFKYTLAATYEAKGDKEKACINYRAIASVPQFKEYAEFKIKELKCK